MSNKVRELIEHGVVPPGYSLDKICKILLDTKKPNTFEMFGFLSAKVNRKGIIEDLGLVSCRLVTSAFAEYLVDSLQDSTGSPMDVFIWHDSGTGNTAESNSQTALVTPVESRVSGTKVEGASAHIYKSVATVTYTGTHSIVEHGLFSASTLGTMLDRSVITAVAVESADEIEWTYQLTVTAET